MKCEKCGAPVLAFPIPGLPILCSECIDDYYKTRLGEDEDVRSWIRRLKEEG
jgi:hypothetical protein